HAYRPEERRSGEAETRRTFSQAPDVNRDLDPVRTGDEVRRADEIEELFAREPSAPAHELRFHQGDVRGRAPHGRGPELQKQKRELDQRTRRYHDEHARFAPSRRVV